MTEAARAARNRYHREYTRNMTPEQKQHQKEYLAAWRARNRERLREYHSEWRQAHRDKVRAAATRYWEKKAKEGASYGA